MLTLQVAPSDVERLKQGKAPIEGPRRYSPTHHIGRADHEQGANMRLFVGQRELHHLAHHNERLLTSTPHPQPDIGAGSIARQQGEPYSYLRSSCLLALLP